MLANQSLVGILQYCNDCILMIVFIDISFTFSPSPSRLVIPDGQGRVTAVIFGDDHVAPVFAALTLLDSKIWVNARTQIPRPRNSNTIRSLLFISESMEGILQEEMTPLYTPDF